MNLDLPKELVMIKLNLGNHYLRHTVKAGVSLIPRTIKPVSWPGPPRPSLMSVGASFK